MNSRRTSIAQAIRFAEVLCDLVRGDKPRPDIRVWHGEAQVHRVGPNYIELQRVYLDVHGLDYNKQIASLVEAYYGLSLGTLGLGVPTLNHKEARRQHVVLT